MLFALALLEICRSVAFLAVQTNLTRSFSFSPFPLLPPPLRPRLRRLSPLAAQVKELSHFIASLLPEGEQAAFTKDCDALVEKKQLASVLKHLAARARVVLTATKSQLRQRRARRG